MFKEIFIVWDWILKKKVRLLGTLFVSSFRHHLVTIHETGKVLNAKALATLLC